MLSKKTALGAAAPLALLLAAPLDADAMRCGNRLVSRDDSRSRVVAICGQPEDVSSYVAYRSSGHFQYDIFGRYNRRYVVRHGFTGPRVEIPVQIEHWVYNFGSKRLMRRVTFANGRVEQIETLGYGYDARRPPPLRTRDEVRGNWDDDWGYDDTRDRRRSSARDGRRSEPEQDPRRRQPADEERWRRVRVEAAPEYSN